MNSEIPANLRLIWLEWPVKAQPLKATGEPWKDPAGSNLLIQIYCAIKTTQVANAHICSKSSKTTQKNGEAKVCALQPPNYCPTMTTC